MDKKEDKKKILGSRLKVVRVHLNMTQKQFSDKLDIHQQLLSRWERGEHYPTTEILCLISEKFGHEYGVFLITGNLVCKKDAFQNNARKAP